MPTRILTAILVLTAAAAGAATFTMTVDAPVFDQPYALDLGSPVETVHAVSFLIEGRNEPLWYRCYDMGGDSFNAEQTWWPRYVFGDDAVLYDVTGMAPIGVTADMLGVDLADWSCLDDGSSTLTLRQMRVPMDPDCIFDHTDRTLDRLIVSIEYTAVVGNETSRWEAVKRQYR